MNHEIPKGGKMASIGVRRGTDSEDLTNYLIVILSSRCQIDRITPHPVDAHLVIDGDRGNRNKKRKNTTADGHSTKTITSCL